MLSPLDPKKAISCTKYQTLASTITSLSPTGKIVGSALRHPTILAPAIKVRINYLRELDRRMQGHKRVEGTESIPAEILWSKTDGLKRDKYSHLQ